MAFIVEDGSGLDNSNSLISVDFADDYFTDRNNLMWLDSELEEKQVALIKASDYVLYAWENELRGHRLKEFQALPFPRVMTGFDEMPVIMKKAVSEYALRALSGELMPDLTSDASGKLIIEESKSLEGLGDKTVKYSEYTEINDQKNYSVPDRMMLSLCMSNGNVKFLSR